MACLVALIIAATVVTVQSEPLDTYNTKLKLCCNQYFLMHFCFLILVSGSNREQAGGECRSDVAGRGLLARRPPQRSHAGGHPRAHSRSCW
jgi:hypothetical protein